MSRKALIQLLESYIPSNANQILTKERCLEFSQDERCLDKRYEKGHFTASAVVFNQREDSILLVNHKKLKLWLQPGGHFESTEETLLDAARREIKEETGLENLALLTEGIFDLDIHQIPENGGFPPHLHYDLRLAFKINNAEDEAKLIEEEGAQVGWCPLGMFTQSKMCPSITRMLDGHLSKGSAHRDYTEEVYKPLLALPTANYETLVAVLHESNSYPILRLIVENSKSAPWILISAAIHGDERGGALALRELLSEKSFPKEFNYWIYPCINPVGYAKGTRAASTCSDLNRACNSSGTAPEMNAIIADLKSAPDFLCSIEMHEDFPFMNDERSFGQVITDFYIYESSALRSARIGAKLMVKLSSLGVNVFSGTSIYGDSCINGVVLYGEGSENKSYLDLNTFDSYLLRTKTNLGILFEVPGVQSENRRVQLHKQVLLESLKSLIERERMSFVGEGV